jgi:hypothetical protein
MRDRCSVASATSRTTSSTAPMAIRAALRCAIRRRHQRQAGAHAIYLVADHEDFGTLGAGLFV